MVVSDAATAAAAGATLVGCGYSHQLLLLLSIDVGLHRCCCHCSRRLLWRLLMSGIADEYGDDEDDDEDEDVVADGDSDSGGWQCRCCRRQLPPPSSAPHVPRRVRDATPTRRPPPTARAPRTSPATTVTAPPPAAPAGRRRVAGSTARARPASPRKHRVRHPLDIRRRGADIGGRPPALRSAGSEEYAGILRRRPGAYPASRHAARSVRRSRRAGRSRWPRAWGADARAGATPGSS